MVAGICGQVGAVFGINPRVVLPGCQSFVGVLVTSAIGGGVLLDVSNSFQMLRKLN